MAGGKSQERPGQRTAPRPQSKHHIPTTAEGVGVSLTGSLSTDPSPLPMGPTAAGTTSPEPSGAEEVAGPQALLAWDTTAAKG